jgi:hypothetical protein
VLAEMKSESASLLILSWMRPDNLREILTVESKYPLISEIIVFNNNPNMQIPAPNSKVRVLNSSHDFGLRCRWIMGALARNQYLVFQDDDILLPETVLHEFVTRLEGDPRRGYSLHGRNPEGNDEYNFKDVYGEVEIILTRAACIHKSAIFQLLDCEQRFFDGQFPDARSFPGDDIFMSYCLWAIFQKRNIAMHLDYWDLPSPFSLSADPNYRNVRTQIMRRCRAFFKASKS